MRKLIMKMSVSLDGFVSDSNGQNDWIFKSADPTSTAYSAGINAEAGLIIMGRKSFDMMSPYWPTATGPFAQPMNEVPKALFTKKGFDNAEPATATTGSAVKTYNEAKGIQPDANASAAEISWGNTRVYNGDLAEEITQLKEETGKPILAIGGSGFMQDLIATGLIDEFYVVIHPVALGSGMPIFTGLKERLYLKLVDVKTFPGGVTVQIYQK